jgi:multidrug efflux pump subunit AcrB
LAFPTTAVPTPELIVTLSTPHIDRPPDGNIPTTAPNPQDCGYQWANQDLPELSSNFQESIQALQPEAKASAYAFGENCMLADGSVGGFSAMETDFNITLQVNDLTNESDLGEWIVKVMQVIENIPPEQIVGPQPGRVGIIFQSNGDQKAVNFSINQYQALAPGLSTSEIYQALQVPQ